MSDQAMSDPANPGSSPQATVAPTPTSTPTSPPGRVATPRERDTPPLPPFKVILHNDDVNPIDYVVRTLLELTPLTLNPACEVMIEAHTTGVAVVLVTHKERAELYAEQFASKQLTVTIEAAT